MQIITGLLIFDPHYPAVVCSPIAITPLRAMFYGQKSLFKSLGQWKISLLSNGNEIGSLIVDPNLIDETVSQVFPILQTPSPIGFPLYATMQPIGSPAAMPVTTITLWYKFVF